MSGGRFNMEERKMWFIQQMPLQQNMDDGGQGGQQQGGQQQQGQGQQQGGQQQQQQGQGNQQQQGQQQGQGGQQQQGNQQQGQQQGGQGGQQGQQQGQQQQQQGDGLLNLGDGNQGGDGFQLQDIQYEDFTFPEGAAPDKEDKAANERLDLFKKEAAKRGLSQEHAQAALDLMFVVRDSHNAAADAAAVEEKKAWAQASREAGIYTSENMNLASQTVARLDKNNEIRGLLEATGLHHHPVILEVFADYSRKRKESEVPRPGDGLQPGTGTQPTREQRLRGFFSKSLPQQ